ncbi:allantoicase [Cocleimonas sp. KMM 6892]|uniref:allantoicase n=1 Tax=unclassified Cocleimonas TaxID=2639732 RepID=UPI002DB7C9CB|nr:MULTISPECIES: allantoicase [unclassified Cocleimonas]MEB8431731.1 allantoicase [Cocleimonas sp. KMM 6892]MEC4715183.1 allantoicase [Cocleimonas sp. KMM 6895]MEC4744003.1 allantoicase [Cocleimonas sp. KMM 6896]
MIKQFKQDFINLASANLGAIALYATDDFFAAKERLLHDKEPVFIEDKFDDHGKWMDGWESRRKRTPGHDYCIVRLARPGYIGGVVIDTSHFRGNQPTDVSIDYCYCEGVPSEKTEWATLLAKTPVNENDVKACKVECEQVVSHVKLHIYPDGGVARLRVYGRPQCNWDDVIPSEVMDLAAALNGGRAIACSDEHFGIMNNIIFPGKGKNMGDGWETSRRRGPGHDWVIIALGHAGHLKKVVVDTAFFKGNYPDRCSIQAVCLTDASMNTDELIEQSQNWPEILTEQKLEMDMEHNFIDQINDIGAVSHVRLNIYPDGGVSRFRLYGTIGNCNK